MKPGSDPGGGGRGGRGVPLDELTGGAPIAVLAPHPDDESLGCGGLLAGAFAADGAHVICLTDGGASHPATSERSRMDLAVRRRGELIGAIHHLGGSERDLTWLGLRDGEVSQDPAHHPETIERIADIIKAIGARTLFATAAADAHGDHKAAAAIAICVQGRSQGLRLIWYPVWSRWDDPSSLDVADRPVLTLDTQPWRQRKAAAIAAHASQHGLTPGHGPDPGGPGFALDPNFVRMFVEENEIFWKAPG